MNYPYLLSAIFVMALVTYLPRMLPLALFRKPIRSRFIRSFLSYVPYAVLAAMTFPAVFQSTSSYLSALVGLLVALVFAYLEKGLLTVALSATAAVLIVEQILSRIPV